VPSDAPDPPTGPEGVPGRITVGRYSYIVKLGDRDGAKLEALDGGKDSAVLAQAIAKVEAGQGTPTPPAAELDSELGVADQVTTAIELARKLFVQIAQGRPPDLATIDGTVEMLLGLLQRLDLDEHWEQAVRLARDLAMLLALLERWMEILQSLQTALRGAEKAKDISGRAWALHEQGTLQLAAGNHAKADRLLGKAHELREEIHDRSGLRMTEHNLQVLCKTLRAGLHPPQPRPPREWFPLRPPQALVFTMLLLVLGGVAGAVVHGAGGRVRVVTVSAAHGAKRGHRSRKVLVKGHAPKASTVPANVEVLAAPKSVPGGTAVSLITARTLNAHGELIAGHSVNFAVKPEDGSFSSLSASTNADGYVQTKLTFTGARSAAVEDTVEACAMTHVCGTVRVRWQARSTPIAATRAPSEITSTGATLNGTLNPNDAIVTSCYFEYGAGTSYEHTAPCATYESSGSSPEDVSAAVVGLAANTLYRFRLDARSAAGPGEGEPETFTAPEAPAKPTVSTEGFTELTSSSVKVMGSVSPSGSGAEKCEFLYTIAGETNFTGPRTASVECSDFRSGAGTSGAAVTAELSNLVPDQLYDYQLLATVEGSSYDGGSRTFHTEEVPTRQGQKPSEPSSIK